MTIQGQLLKLYWARSGKLEVENIALWHTGSPATLGLWLPMPLPWPGSNWYDVMMSQQLLSVACLLLRSAHNRLAYNQWQVGGLLAAPVPSPDILHPLWVFGCELLSQWFKWLAAKRLRGGSNGHAALPGVLPRDIIPLAPSDILIRCVH